MEFIRKLPEIEDLQNAYALTQAQENEKKSFICSIKNILSGDDDRKLLIVGPCSADREDAVVSYIHRLAAIAEKVSDKIFIVPRIYTSKPRSKGTGYKGMLHNPQADDKEDLLKGIEAVRKLHLNIIKESGLYAADEMLYPEEIYYVKDLLAYMAVGARSVEDQGHRLAASDDTVPVGMKNPLSGSKVSLVNSVKAAQVAHSMIYRGWEVATKGNKWAHCILRGFDGADGKSKANYHFEELKELYDLCIINNVLNPGVIIDCNHGNSGKVYDEQPRIAKEVAHNFKQNKILGKFVKGWMVESYLEDGAQKPGGDVYGKSITDPCLGWEKTEKMIYELADVL